MEACGITFTSVGDLVIHLYSHTHQEKAGSDFHSHSNYADELCGCDFHEDHQDGFARATYLHKDIIERCAKQPTYKDIVYVQKSASFNNENWWVGDTLRFFREMGLFDVFEHSSPSSLRSLLCEVSIDSPKELRRHLESDEFRAQIKQRTNETNKEIIYTHAAHDQYLKRFCWELRLSQARVAYLPQRVQQHDSITVQKLLLTNFCCAAVMRKIQQFVVEGALDVRKRNERCGSEHCEKSVDQLIATSSPPSDNDHDEDLHQNFDDKHHVSTIEPKKAPSPKETYKNLVLANPGNAGVCPRRASCHTRWKISNPCG